MGFELRQARNDELTELFIAFTDRPDDEDRRRRLLAALDDPSVATHWVKDAAESWLAADPPNDDVLLVRLETELLRLTAAVRLQRARIPAADAGRVGELLLQKVDDPVNTEQVEADLHFFLIAAAGVFACARSACERLALAQPDEPANLRAARNISQHIEAYNVGDGRNASIRRHQVQTWRLRSEGGRPVWTWAGIEIDVHAIAEQAIDLAGQLVREITRRVPSSARGDYMLVSDRPEDDIG